MGTPKRRHGNARTRKRRTHDKIHVDSLSTCPSCNASRKPHRVCPKCGYYKGKPVLTMTGGEAR